MKAVYLTEHGDIDKFIRLPLVQDGIDESRLSH
jgi:hypothetical protein